MLDGCRWDYFKRNAESHPAYRLFESEGVVADYVQPIFPSSSFESWTTINTGLYSEYHGILANNMWDRNNTEFFQLGNDNSTGNPRWWTDHIPIWTSLTKQGFNVSLHQWSRCDVPFKIDDQDIKPKKCTPYLDADAYDVTIQDFQLALTEAYTGLKSNEFDVAFVYFPNTDNLGHGYNPESFETMTGVWQVDQTFLHLLQTMKNESFEINMIVVADHGMTKSSNFVHEKLTSYLSNDTIDAIELIVDGRNIAVKNGQIDAVFNELKKHDDKLLVYKKEDIPEWYHVKNAKYIQDILIDSKHNNVTLGADNDHPDLYFPRAAGNETEEAQSQGGDHGYRDITANYTMEGDFPDMRAIFMAIGPAFKQGYANPWIKLVDEYQVMMHVMDAKAQANNGTWDRVKCMFKNVDCTDPDSKATNIALANSLLLLLVFAMFI